MSQTHAGFKEFWEEEASRWSLANKNPLVGWYAEHMSDEQEGQLLFRGVPADTNLLALEYGCGPGRNIIKFRDRFARVDGVDISPTILAKLPSNLEESGVQVPNVWLTNGFEIPQVPDNTYDVVFSIICQQHITYRSWRLNLYKEFLRVLKPGGVFTFQMGYGPGHPISVDYFFDDLTPSAGHRDVRVEDAEVLKKDLEDSGFTNVSHILTVPNHDQHPQWIWVTCQRPVVG